MWEVGASEPLPISRARAYDALLIDLCDVARKNLLPPERNTQKTGNTLGSSILPHLFRFLYDRWWGEEEGFREIHILESCTAKKEKIIQY